MKKLLTLLILTSSLQTMQQQPTANVTATDTVAINSQPTAGAVGAQTTAMQTDQFKFHLGIPSLLRKAAARTTPESAESCYQEQSQLDAQIDVAKEAHDAKKVAKLKEQRKVIPWPILEEAQQQLEKDTDKKITDALRKDDPRLLTLAMEEIRIDPTTLEPIIDPTTGTPVLEAVTLDRFIRLAKKAVDLNAKRCLNFLLTRAKNIPLSTLNELLTYADNNLVPAQLLQLLINRAMNDTQGHPRGEFFDKWNDFPLHKAVIENKALEVAKLIDDKVDVNMVAHDMTPLLLACKYNCDNNAYTIATLLIKKGANVNFLDKNGMTPLMYASSNDCAGVAKLLIEHNATIDARGILATTPLLFATFNGHTHVAEVLLDHGANVNAQNTPGFTPLLYASLRGDTDTVKLLLAHGADRTLKTSDGETALDRAKEKGHTDIVDLLKPKHETVYNKKDTSDSQNERDNG
jgi:ankyrin repeat protein